MSDQAWASMIASDSFDLEAIEEMLSHFNDLPTDFEPFWQDVISGNYKVHPRYFIGIDFNRTDVKREEIYECWRANIWKQAVLHAECKARMGIEPHWLLYYIEDMNISSRFGHNFVGFIPQFSNCECCWKNKIMTNGDEYVDTLFYQCQECIDAGHEPGQGMIHRWHECLGRWWVEIQEDNGPGFYPSSWVGWFNPNEEGEGEAVARAVAIEARSKYPAEDKIVLYSPAGEAEEIMPDTDAQP